MAVCYGLHVYSILTFYSFIYSSMHSPNHSIKHSLIHSHNLPCLSQTFFIFQFPLLIDSRSITLDAILFRLCIWKKKKSLYSRWFVCLLRITFQRLFKTDYPYLIFGNYVYLLLFLCTTLRRPFLWITTQNILVILFVHSCIHLLSQHSSNSDLHTLIYSCFLNYSLIRSLSHFFVYSFFHSFTD